MVNPFHSFWRRSSSIVSLTLLGFLPVLLFIASQLPAHGQKLDRPAEKLRLADLRFLGSCGVNIALEKGFFHEKGVDISRSFYLSGKENLDALMTGKAELATVADFPIVVETLKGAKPCVVGTLSYHSHNFSIIARKDRGISSLGDLEGKKIGVTMATNAHFALDNFLLFHRVPRDRIRLVDLPVNRMLEKIRTGDVQAVVTWDPFSTLIRTELGTNAVTFSGDERQVYRLTWNLVGLRDFVSRNPETIRHVLRALMRSEEFIKNNPDPAMEMTSGFLGLGKTSLRGIWNTCELNLSLTPLLIQNLENQSRWAIRKKLTGSKQMPNYLESIYFGGLESVKPDSVTIIHRRES